MRYIAMVVLLAAAGSVAPQEPVAAPSRSPSPSAEALLGDEAFFSKKFVKQLNAVAADVRAMGATEGRACNELKGKERFSLEAFAKKYGPADKVDKDAQRDGRGQVAVVSHTYGRLSLDVPERDTVGAVRWVCLALP